MLNSTNNSQTRKEEREKSAEKSARIRNIESYYSKKNLEKYLNSNDDQEHIHNKKYMGTKAEKSPEIYAENRAHFFRINYNKKQDLRAENAFSNEHQKKILETR